MIQYNLALLLGFLYFWLIPSLNAEELLDQPNRIQLFVNTSSINASVRNIFLNREFSFIRSDDVTFWSQLDEVLQLENPACKELTLDPASFSIEIDDLRIEQIPHERAIKIVIAIKSVSAGGHITLDGCLPMKVDDDFQLDISEVSLNIAIAPIIEEGELNLKLVGEPRVELGKISLDLEKVWNGFETISNFLVSFLTRTSLKVMKGVIATTLAERIASVAVPLFKEDFQPDPLGMGPGGISFGYGAQVTDIEPKNSGIYVDAEVRTTLNISPSDCAIDPTLPPLHSKSPVPNLQNFENDSHIAAAVPDSLINDTLYRLWQSGQFCITKTKIDPILSLKWSVVLREMEHLLKINLVLYAPPVLRFGRNDHDGIVIELRDLDVVLAFQEELTQKQLYELGLTKVRLKGDIDLLASLKVDHETNLIKLTIDSVNIVDLNLEINGRMLDESSLFDEAELTDYIFTSLLPDIAEQLEAAPILPPSVFNVVDGLKVTLDEIILKDGYVNVFVSALYKDDPRYDGTAPDTQILGFEDNYGVQCEKTEPSITTDPEVQLSETDLTQIAADLPAQVCTSSILFSVAANDDRTNKIIYEYAVLQCADDKPVGSNEITIDCTKSIELDYLEKNDAITWTKSFTPDIELPTLAPGRSYIFMVRSWDDYQNVDPSPASVFFTIEEATSSSGCGFLKPSTGSAPMNSFLLIFLLLFFARLIPF